MDIFWTPSIKYLCFLLICHLGILADLLLSYDDKQHHKNDSKDNRNPSLSSSSMMTNTKLNEVDTTHEVYDLIRNTASLGGPRTNYSLVESNVLRITSNYPIIDNEGEEESTNKPILQKIQGEYIETGGGGNFGFFQRQDEDIGSQVALSSDLTLLPDTIENITEDITTQR